tara:strand:- start:882 stop:1337 length:456 start_codon:yes stop_codon:yes gene_type:complete
MQALHDMTDATEFEGRGCFIGLNNMAMSRGGIREEGQPLLILQNESSWLNTIKNLTSMGVAPPIALSIDAANPDVYTAMLTDVQDPAVAERGLVVRYWGLELASNPTGTGTGDPRAQVVCSALTNTYHRWPYVYVYAQLAYPSPCETPKDA